MYAGLSGWNASSRFSFALAAACVLKLCVCAASFRRAYDGLSRSNFARAFVLSLRSPDTRPALHRTRRSTAGSGPSLKKNCKTAYIYESIGRQSKNKVAFRMLASGRRQKLCDLIEAYWRSAGMASALPQSSNGHCVSPKRRSTRNVRLCRSSSSISRFPMRRRHRQRSAPQACPDGRRPCQRPSIYTLQPYRSLCSACQKRGKD